MSYLHCHNCGWQQDDYWSKGYNPIRFLQNFEEDILQPDIDAVVHWDKTNSTTYRQVVLAALEKATEKVKNMVYATREQYRAKNVKRLCPVCEQHSLDED